VWREVAQGRARAGHGPASCWLKMVAQGIVAESRPDVAAALGNPYWASLGFTAQVPAASLRK